MGDPVTALAFQGGSKLLGGLAARGQAKTEQQRAEINSYIGQTRAMQTATTGVEGLNSELATLRATLASNNQGMDAGSAPFMSELRRTRTRESRIQVDNELMGVEDDKMNAKAAKSRAMWAPVIGFSQAAPSMYDIYQLGR